MSTMINISSNSIKDKINNSLKMVETSLSTKSTSKNESFKDLLNLKSNYNDSDIQERDDTDISESSINNEDTSNLDELKEKLEELEEESKSNSEDSGDKVNDILNEIISLLNKLGINAEDLSSGETSAESSVMKNLMELLKTDSAKNTLDTDSLELMKKLFSNLSDEKSEDVNGVKDLISQIAKMIQSKQNQNEKVLSLKDMLNKDYSQDNSESSNSNQSNTSTSSKEEKFLNSLVEDNTDSSLDKINLFASRTQIIQNQGTENVRGLTINKATFVEDLIKDVKYMSNNGIKELTVKVNPGNLGEISIQLTQEDGVLKANLKASSKDTANLLLQNLNDIKKQLNEQNIKIEDVNIELYQEDTMFHSGEGFNSELAQEQQKNTSSNTSEEISIEDNSIENIETIYDGNLSFLA